MFSLRFLPVAEGHKVDAPFFLHGAQRVVENLGIQRVEQVVVLVAEMLGDLFLTVKQIGADDAKRSFFGEEGGSIFP